MVPECSGNCNNTTNSVVKYDSVSYLNSCNFVLVVAFVIYTEAFSLSTFAQHGSRISTVRHIENLMRSLFLHDGHTSSRAAAIAVQESQLGIKLHQELQGQAGEEKKLLTY